MLILPPDNTSNMRIKSNEEMSLRVIRQNAGMGMDEFAQICGVSVGELKKYERSLVLPDDGLMEILANRFSLKSGEVLDSHRVLLEDKKIGEGYVTASIQAQEKFARTAPLQNKVPILDLFCGVGGFSHGFERTGEFEVVAGLDLLGDRIKTFQLNHTHADTYSWDIYDLNPKKIIETSPSPKVVIGGPPCQGFSSIRPYRSLISNDRRNNLFEQFAYYVSVLKPEWFVLENVIGLITHNKGETLKALLVTFESIGYKIEYKALNAASYGLPQSRERVIVVGNDKNIRFEFPKPTHLYEFQTMMKDGKKDFQRNLFNQDIPPALSIMDAIHDLPEIPSGGKATHYKPNVELTDFERKMRGNVQVLTLHESTQHSDKMMEIIRKSGDNISAVAGLVSSGFSTSYSRLDPKRPAVTITVNFVHPSSNKCIHPYQDRALTPREGARLQSFPDYYNFSGTKTQIIKQIGNAVPPLLGEVIARQIINYMG
jgi:DNA (cytosine-5)-methyltransferase 1